jgi:hypothetical protein
MAVETHALHGRILAAVFGGERAQVEQIAGDAGPFDFLTRQLHEPERLRHLAGTRLVGPRGAAHEQDPRGRGWIVVLPLCVENALPRFEPLNREGELRVGKARTGLSRARTLVIFVVHLPRDVDDAIDVRASGFEQRVVEAFAIAALEFGAAQVDVTLARSRLR